MILDPPDIDSRSEETILDEIQERSPFYVSEWDVTATDGPGYALLKSFSQLLEDIIEHLNAAPRKNFIEYLDRLGITLRPALAARVPVTFVLSNGTKTNVTIPERTQAAASASEE